jgi:hypothetical protein
VKAHEANKDFEKNGIKTDSPILQHDRQSLLRRVRRLPVNPGGRHRIIYVRNLDDPSVKTGILSPKDLGVSCQIVLEMMIEDTEDHLGIDFTQLY